MSGPAEEYLTVEELARRLGCSPKTVQNKMSGPGAIFKRGIHYDSPPGLPTLFRWSAVLALYHFEDIPTRANSASIVEKRAAAGARQPGETKLADKRV
jgi:hypothetical protein